MLVQTLTQTPGQAGAFRFRILSSGRGDACLVAAMLAECLSRQGFHTEVPAPAADMPAADAAEVTVGDAAADPAADLLVLVDEELLERADLLAGLSPGGTLLVATGRSPAALRDAMPKWDVRVATVDSTDLAVSHGADWAAPVLGAMARLTGFLNPDSLGPAVWTAYDRQYPYLAASAIRACRAGYQAVRL